MAKKKTSKKFQKALEQACVDFGYAMRHTNINHHTKSEEGWRKFSRSLARLIDATP